MNKRKARRSKQKMQRNPSQHEVALYLARGRRAGPGDLATRIPELAPLSESSVALFGVGGIGAPAALELARAGVGELRLLDHDVVDPATAVRWPLGFAAAELAKVDALGDFIRVNHPYTSVHTERWRLGTARMENDETESEAAVLARMFDGADLVFDCTAESGVGYALSELAREANLNYLTAWTTAGAWGGVIARVRADAPGCWLCLMQHLEDGSIPPPPHDPEGNIQPIGCADPTFIGAGFDVSTISLAAVRLAVSTICDGTAGGYPAVPWDVCVISLRQQDVPGLATIATVPLTAHPACPRCAG
jgi:molybdopterin/thiamine biosynthesis adenylyltransferase